MAIPNNITNHYFKPRRGSKTEMNKKTTFVLAEGELFLEYPDTGVGTGACKIKVGDGVTAYPALQYAIDLADISGSTVTFNPSSAETVEAALLLVASGNTNAVLFANIKKAVELLNSQTIKYITVDGVQLDVDDNAVSFLTPTYEIEAEEVSGSNQASINLNDSNAGGKETTTIYIGSNDESITVSTSSNAIDLSLNVTGAASTIIEDDLYANYALVSSSAGKVATSDVTATELGYLADTTANIQSQLNDKQDAITGAASSIVDDNLTSDMVVVTDENGKIDASSISTTELGYLTDTTANIQSQLDNKAAATHTHGLDSADLTGYLDVAKLYGGANSAGHLIDISLLPHGALERLYVATDEAEIRTLTKTDIQNGDVVKNEDTGVMYYVFDDDELPIGEKQLSVALQPFVAGSVEWAAINNKPTEFPPEAHTHTMANITDLYGNFSGATSAANGTTGFVPAPVAGDQNKYLRGDGSWTSFAAFSGATSAAAGTMGQVPAPAAGDEVKYLRGDGTWAGNATTAVAGLLSAADKAVIDSVADGSIFDFGNETPVTP